MVPSPAKTRQNRLFLIIMLGFAILGCSLVIGLIPYQIDDAFITFRYARSLLQGHGFSFNPEGPWVEGFSSPAWLLLLAGLAGVFGHHAIPTLATILCFLCYVLCMYWLCEPVHDQLRNRRHPGNLFALALFISSPAFFYYSVTGLETLLFLLVLLIFARSASGSASLPAGILCGLVATWIRPEGPWFLPMLLIQACVMAPRQFFRQRRFWLLAGSVVTGSALLAGLRLWLFGYLVPNTYFAKPMVIADAAMYIRSSFLNGWALLLLLLALLGAICGQRKHRGYFLAALSWILAAFLEGGDWMAYGRMLIPAFGLLCLSMTGIHGLLFGRQNFWRRIGQGLAIISAVAACGFGLQDEMDSKRLAHYAFEKTFYVEEIMAGWINESRVHSVATIDIGMLGYYAPISIFDLAGLTDTRIAHSPGPHLGKMFPLDYLFSEKRAELIILRTSARPETMTSDFKIRNTGSDVEFHLATDPRMSSDYRFVVGFFTSDEKYGWYGKLIFARSDIVIPGKLVPANRIIYLPVRPAISSEQSGTMAATRGPA